MLTAAETTPDSSPPTSMIVLVLLLVGGGVIYTFGYARAVMHRANKDYKATKAAVPGLRKNFWLTLWAAVKASLIIVAGLMILFVWVVRDVKDSPAPAPSHSAPAKLKKK